MNNEQAKLVDELYHNANVSGQPLEQRLADLAVWFFSNKDRIPENNLKSRCEFYEKAIWVLIELAALQAERAHELGMQGAKQHLWLPNGLRFDGKQYK